MDRRLLIVRLGALGDIVHALPVAAAIRRAWPRARIDWVVDERYRAVLSLVRGLDHVIEVRTNGWPAAIPALRRARYDFAIDLQGLLKSAVLARASGARRVIGFGAGHLREGAARMFYTDAVTPAAGLHVIGKNMAMLAAIGVGDDRREFPIDAPDTGIDARVRSVLGIAPGARYAIINPGAGWPNKQWPPERLGATARHLSARHAMKSVVLWGPREQALAGEVAAASGGSAVVAPETTLADLVGLCRAAGLIVSGDTGPLHLAAALGTPAVSLFGPTDPARNGPWRPEDVAVSRFDRCDCHHKRRCRRPSPCLMDVTVEEMTAAVDRRLGLVGGHG